MAEYGKGTDQRPTITTLKQLEEFLNKGGTLSPAQISVLREEKIHIETVKGKDGDTFKISSPHWSTFADGAKKEREDLAMVERNIAKRAEDRAKPTWQERPFHLRDEESWSTRKAHAEAMIAANDRWAARLWEAGPATAPAAAPLPATKAPAAKMGGP